MPVAVAGAETVPFRDKPLRCWGERTAGMKQKTTQLLYAYWNELRAGRLAPNRLEIEPSRIGSILAETFMLERESATVYRYRLAGTRICEVFGSELRGANLLEGWSAPDRAALAGDLAATCAQGAVTLLTLEAGEGQRRLQIEAILLPLFQPEGTVGRVLGAMSPLTSPHWLGHERLGTKRLVRRELVWPDGRPYAIAKATGRTSPPAGGGSATAASRWRNFRVLEGGRGKV